LALLAFTPLNLAFDCFSQHMRAILEFLQHVIDASDCSALEIDGKHKLSRLKDWKVGWITLLRICPA
jgi:hypothetical protein